MEIVRHAQVEGEVEPEHPLLLISGYEMVNLYYNLVQCTLLDIPSYNVRYLTVSISPTQVRIHRLSYINALLIESRGVRTIVAYIECLRYSKRPFPILYHRTRDTSVIRVPITSSAIIYTNAIVPASLRKMQSITIYTKSRMCDDLDDNASTRASGSSLLLLE